MVVDRFVEAAVQEAQKSRTENNAATYYTTDDPRIDFFFQVLETTADTETIALLERSWNHNCLDTLRLIAYLRDIRSGKSIRYQYYVCLYWIYQHHPRTLLQNLPIFIECGYWKDPLQLLMIVLFRGKVAKYLFNEEHTSYTKRKSAIEAKRKIDTFLEAEDESNKKKLFKKKSSQKEIAKIKSKFYEETVSEPNEYIVDHYKDEIDKKYKPMLVEKTVRQNRSNRGVKPKKTTEIVSRGPNHVDRKFLKELTARFARERFNKDKKYRYFHLKVAEVIAKQLIDDLASLKSKDYKKISLTAKWAPSLQGHFDKYTLISSSVALQIAKLTRAEDASLEEIFTKPIPIGTYLARKHYQKTYIVKLREQLRIPERYMCTNQWEVLPYQMVASKCMQQNRKLFMKHDQDRFEQFVKSREKVAGATLKPPELIERAMKLQDNEELEKELLEKQWNSLKDSIKLDDKDSCFKSALSVCDVSGSMSGTPMNAAIGLTLMTMSFTNEPWSNLCLTFEKKPQFVHFEKNQTIYEKVHHLQKAPWGSNTDLTKTFKLILSLAEKHELKQSEMPKYLFIFSDMEFDQACRPKETNYEEATRLFAEKGYELPTIVFWNLRPSHSIPVQKNERGTVLLSGYSAQQLSMLLKVNLDEITPTIFIDDILKMEKYANLVVVD